MIVKKIFSITLIILLLNTNFAFAENWVTITAENGKSADLDLDSIQIAIDTVEYDIRTRNNDFIYINKMSTELYKEGIPTAVIERTKYKDNIPISNEKINTRSYRTLKAGTLQSEIFDVLSKELDKNTFTQGKRIWDKYLKRQRKKVYEHWKPNGKNWVTTSDFTSPVNIDKIVLIVDKDGIIKSKYSQDSPIKDLPTIEPLPDDYTADTFKLDVKMNYYKYAGAKLNTKKPVVKQISPVHSEITIAKNKRPPIIGHIQLGLLWCYKTINKIFLPEQQETNLFTFPLVLVGCLCGVVGIAVCLIFCLVSGVDLGDL